MPTDTFMKLPIDKRKKVIASAKKEFSRVPFSEVSIKNIVEDAEIARGSFYQYFTSKKDLLTYIVKNHIYEIDTIIEKSLKENSGDIFLMNISIYDYVIQKCTDYNEQDFYKKIFQNMKLCEDNFLDIKELFISNDISKYFNLIDISKLNINSREDLNIIINLLFTVTTKAIATYFTYQSKESAKAEYIKQLEYLKNGIYKQK